MRAGPSTMSSINKLDQKSISKRPKASTSTRDAEIIDKAKGVGGRASNKKITKSVSFDHGLQYFSPKDIKFKKYLDKLVKKRILKNWDGN